MQQSSKKRESVYLILAVAGTLAPAIFGAPYLLEHGYNPAHLMPTIFSDSVSAMVGINVIIACVALAFLMHNEAPGLGVKTWAPTLAIIIVGISSGLPLYLYLKEKALREAEETKILKN